MLAGLALVVARDYVTRHVTSRALGSLAPGFAATRLGYVTYAGLVGDIGLILIAIDVAFRSPAGVWLVVLAIAAFFIGSIVAIGGEVRTYRALKR